MISLSYYSETMIVFLSIIFMGSVNGCVRTSDTGTSTTGPGTGTTVGTGSPATMAPGTTVTPPAATTTTLGTGCNSCTPSQVTLSGEPNGGPDTHPPEMPPVVGMQDGCATLTVTCLPVNNNGVTIMTFQDGLGSAGMGPVVMVTLMCSEMGGYQLAGRNGPPITAVYCD